MNYQNFHFICVNGMYLGIILMTINMIQYTSIDTIDKNKEKKVFFLGLYIDIPR